MLDSGADLTVLPQSAISRLGVVPESDQLYELAGFDGQRSFANAVLLDMTFLAKTFRGRYLLSSHEIGILGRDVLNYFVVVLARLASGDRSILRVRDDPEEGRAANSS